MSKKAFALISIILLVFLHSGIVSASRNHDDAQAGILLYEEAIEFHDEGDIQAAIDAYSKAIRLNRSVLAYNDYGLIEKMKNDVKQKLEQTPDDPKLLEEMAFIYAVCYSENKKAIKYYSKVLDHVDDEKVISRVNNLIVRLEATVEVVTDYKDRISEQRRQERLASWEEMDRLEKLAQEREESQRLHSRLAELNRQKESKEAIIPQLEQEIESLTEERASAHRLWLTQDEPRHRRRRNRLDDEIEEKQSRLTEARSAVERHKSEIDSLEQQIEQREQEQEERQDSPFRSYDSHRGTTGTYQKPMPGMDSMSPQRSEDLQRHLDNL